MKPLPCHIYRAFAADGRLLYVGKTIYPERRIKQHSQTSHWFAEVAEWEFTEVGDWWQMNRGELAAIKAENPLYNVVGKPKKETPA